MAQIGVPSVGGVKSALTDYAYGAGGAVAYGITSSIFGSGLLGSLASAALAGSVIKGERGTIIATTLGFLGLMSSMSGVATTEDSSAEQGVM